MKSEQLNCKKKLILIINQCNGEGFAFGPKHDWVKPLTLFSTPCTSHFSPVRCEALPSCQRGADWLGCSSSWDLPGGIDSYLLHNSLDTATVSNSLSKNTHHHHHQHQTHSKQREEDNRLGSRCIRWFFLCEQRREKRS